MSKAPTKRAGANVFADLRVPDAETHLLKAQLVARVQDVVRSKRLTQVRAAELKETAGMARALYGKVRLWRARPDWLILP